MPNTHPIAIFGDWHGNAGWALTAIRSAARAGVRTAIHVGDFGLDWPGAKRGRYEGKLNKYLVELDMTLVVSGGNHDNWDTLEKLVVEGDGLATIRSNIRVLPRGGRTLIDGLVIGGLGGAFSVDFEYRVEGKDWWSNEEPTREEAEALVAGGPVDVLITHDAPEGVPVEGDIQLRAALTAKANRTRGLLKEVVDALAVPHLFCGHWHQRGIHQLSLPNGLITRVDVLDMENSRNGNGVLVWPGKAPLRIEPLEIRDLQVPASARLVT
ncbi:metallophosphoesterase [Pseudarthrobacter sp. BRE9]|uniref:metallophosphoesterase family protein n=1 Tax=Pseudarthrobacter sp. BRE9 TaxID=2962582 RepID=UPI0028822AD2|nr:metallophosphoesterase [Pseudarthrobacter sp. BRE9]MDT0168874.1 metallophosphoesterase [Pseudarthrobacter sp. BRE9]